MKALTYIKKHPVKIISILLALLFMYAAVSKVLDFENFQVQLAQSPLLSAYAGMVSYSIITLELIVAIMLGLNSTRLQGLYASLGLMAGFTIYIYLILNFSDFIPCSCGGILEKLGWTEHLIFNIVFVLLTILAIYIHTKTNSLNIKGTLFKCALVAVISCILVIIMFRSSEYIIKKENNFTRRFLLHPVLLDKKVDIGLNSYYFAGIDENYIYLGNTTAPLLITTMNLSLDTTYVVKAKLDNRNHPFRNLKLSVNTPFYYLFDGTVPIIYRGPLGDSLARTISFGDAYFNQLVVVDSMKFAIRTQKKSDKEFTLASLNLDSRQKLELKPAILQKQIDGVFDIDGLLISDRYSGQMVYTYTYRNQFIILDSSFKVLNRLNTIDTTSSARISVTRLSNGSRKMNAPPYSVNKGSVLFGKLLFNRSNLKGKHEPDGSWKTATIIDVYRTDEQKYIGSFYIHHVDGTGMSSMIADKKNLYVLIGKEILRYRIRIDAFK